MFTFKFLSKFPIRLINKFGNVFKVLTWSQSLVELVHLWERVVKSIEPFLFFYLVQLPKQLCLLLFN